MRVNHVVNAIDLHCAALLSLLAENGALGLRFGFCVIAEVTTRQQILLPSNHSRSFAHRYLLFSPLIRSGTVYSPTTASAVATALAAKSR